MAKRIKHWLKIRQMTVRTLAELLYIDPSTLSYWMNRDEVPAYILKRISKILRVPVEELVA